MPSGAVRGPFGRIRRAEGDIFVHVYTTCIRQSLSCKTFKYLERTASLLKMWYNANWYYLFRPQSSYNQKILAVLQVRIIVGKLYFLPCNLGQEGGYHFVLYSAPPTSRIPYDESESASSS